jgi:UDP-glucose 4-epimerase
MPLHLRHALVTGGAGFIGSELVHQLVAMGVQVTVVDTLINGKRENLADLASERCTLVVADIRDRERMAKLLVGVDVVYALACLGVRHSIYNPHENHAVNATATLHLLELARQANVPRFVYVSSSEVYGTALYVPQPEDHPTYPMTVYGAAKLAGEAYTRAYQRTYGYPTVVVRPFNSYGPRSHHEGDSGEVIPKFMLRAMAGKPLIVFGDGNQTRDFIYVSDTARGILLAGVSEALIGETVNIGGGYEITINQLAAHIQTVTGNTVPIEYHEQRMGDTLRLYADVTKAQQLLGFTPQVSLSLGLEYLYAWYQAQGGDAAQWLTQEVVYNWQKQDNQGR